MPKLPINETFYGFIETTTDALLLFEACRRGVLPKISRRLQERERCIIRSGSVFIFDEKESGIKRWTDGRAWSPSRILGNFLIYRELDNRETLNQKQQHDSRHYEPYYTPPHDPYFSRISDEEERQRDRNLIGSLTDTYKFLRNGLIKKTISIHLNGYSQHLVSYYSKSDVINAKLATPSATPELSSLQITPELLLKQSFRVPPSVEFADLYLKGSPPSSSTTSSASSSRRVSDSDVMNSSRRPSYARHADPDHFNMPPLNIVTDTFLQQENKSAYPYTYKSYTLPSMVWPKNTNHHQLSSPNYMSCKPYNGFENIL